MKISYNWLQEYGALYQITENGAPSPADFAEKIYQAGYEVEGITYVKKADGVVLEDDTIIDFTVHRNRADLACQMWNVKDLCGIYHMSYHDLARYGMYGPKFNLENHKVTKTNLHLYSTTKKCKMIIGRIVRHVVAKPWDDEWYLHRMIANGYTPTFNLKDIPLFCSRNQGAPLWFIDLKNMEKEELIVEEATRPGTVVMEGKEYAYREGDVIITCNGRVVSVCGVVVSDDFAVTEETTGILGFSMIIDVDTVREYAARVGVDNNNTRFASIVASAADVLRVATSAIGFIGAYCEADGIETVEMYNKYNMARKFHSYTVAEINELLNTDFTFEEIKEALDNPELETSMLDEERVCTMFPSYRVDNQVNEIAQSLLSYLGCSRIVSVDC